MLIHKLRAMGHACSVQPNVHYSGDPLYMPPPPVTREIKTVWQAKPTKTNSKCVLLFLLNFLFILKNKSWKTKALTYTRHCHAFYSSSKYLMNKQKTWPGLEFYRSHHLRCPGLDLEKCSHRHSDILMEVPFTQEKWHCPYKNEISGLLGMVCLKLVFLKHLPANFLFNSLSKHHTVAMALCLSLLLPCRHPTIQCLSGSHCIPLGKVGGNRLVQIFRSLSLFPPVMGNFQNACSGRLLLDKVRLPVSECLHTS